MRWHTNGRSLAGGRNFASIRNPMRRLRVSRHFLQEIREVVGMLLLFVGMREKFPGDGLRVEPACHEVMSPVPQDADDLGGECVIEKPQYVLAIGALPRSDRALVDVLTRPLAQLLHVAGN